MAKGRPPDPNREKRGTGHRPLAGEVVPTKSQTDAELARTIAEQARYPIAPPDLPRDAVAIWDVMIEELWGRGIRDADLESVRQMVIAAHRHRQATALIEQHGLMVRSRGQIVVNPALRVEREMATLFMKYAEAFGLTLSARVRLGLMRLAGESILASLNSALDQEVG